MNNFLYDTAPDGYAAFALPPLLKGRTYLWIVEDLPHAERLQAHLRFFHPTLTAEILPAWDCLPYDRIAPAADICATRMATLAKLQTGVKFVIAPVNACLQKLPPKSVTEKANLHIEVGQEIGIEKLRDYLQAQNYERVDAVRIAGQYSVRGSLLDVFPAGTDRPCRIDFFGDEIEKIRTFDPLSQLSEGSVKNLPLTLAKEAVLSAESAELFCRNYRSLFGQEATDDRIFQSIKSRVPYPSMEHWLPLFYESMSCVFDYVDGVIAFDDYPGHVNLRLEIIEDHFSARQEALQHGGGGKDNGDPYRPLPTDSLYLSQGEWQAQLDNLLDSLPLIRTSPFAVEQADKSLGGKLQDPLAADRHLNEGDIFTALQSRLNSHKNKKIIIACHNEHSLNRMQNLLQSQNIGHFPVIKKFSDHKKYDSHKGFLCVLPLLQGFAGDNILVLAEADIFGETHPRQSRRKRHGGDDFIREVSALNVGDLAVHEDHGIGRFLGLKTLEVEGISHECVELEYADAARLLVPVENVEMLSRYGGEDMNHPLDNLGQAAWQSRKAKIKKRLKDMTEKLVRTAAERALTRMPVMHGQGADYDSFCGGFPFAETDDQLAAIADVMGDLSAGRPMDRLICGDTGFGKTEVALRAAFVNAYQGGQTAVIAPTTLLARQHYLNFQKRFDGLPVQIAMLSRLTSQKNKKMIRAGLADGTVDIVIGTHALLQKSVRFHNLTLAIIDEEQHFGVKQKQRLKEHKVQAEGKTHILTLSATPIPRTMQMAVHGIQDMSIIATPPIDRLAVHSFVTAYDPIVVRDAIVRERVRGGQFFAVVPRISDLRRVAELLKEVLPDLQLAEAHGQMSGDVLEDIMTQFINGDIEGLLSTNIIESGIDIPNANTMFIFRPEIFSLAQLYQLRGRIGRSNRRGYCYMMTPADKILTAAAKKRLEIMQTLDNVGAGFTLASYDMDIRGAGNLLGEEQSGHIREVGVELFQKLLRQAVRDAKARLQEAEVARREADFSPVLNLGVKVMIPEEYIGDLNLRLNFYQRLAGCEERAEVGALAEEMQDRFGTLPWEVELLCGVSVIKINCKKAGIAKVNAGDRGATLYFHENRFGNVEGLVEFMHANSETVQLQADHSLRLTRRWRETEVRLRGLRKVTEELARVARGDDGVEGH